jgi:peptidyl-prolyl cis-trans isomerase SurA
MKCWKQFNLLVCCGLLGLMTTAFPANKGSAETVDRIIAKVDEKIITQSELEERTFVKIMAIQKANVRPMPSQKEVMYDELKRMIDEKLLLGAGRKVGLEVTEENVTKAINDIKTSNGLQEGQLEKMLEAESKSIEEYKKKIHDQIMISKVISFEVRKRVVVSDDEIEKYYNEHLKDYWISEKLRLRHILFLMNDSLLEEDKRTKKRKAREALRKIRMGEDFVTVAKKYSEDISASTGGDLGEIERGKMVPEFEKAAFLLKEGEVSSLVKTPYGLHIIKVDKIIPGETLPLDKVKDQIRNRFLDDKMNAAYKEYLAELKQNAFVENKMPPPPQSVVNNTRKTTPGKTLNPSSKRGEVLADIPPPQKKKGSRRHLTEEQKFSRFQTFEEKLRYYKQLRNKNKISEGEYQNKKRELLNHF